MIYKKRNTVLLSGYSCVCRKTIGVQKCKNAVPEEGSRFLLSSNLAFNLFNSRSNFVVEQLP